MAFCGGSCSRRLAQDRAIHLTATAPRLWQTSPTLLRGQTGESGGWRPGLTDCRSQFGWTSHSSLRLDPVPFDLVSSSGAMIYVQTSPSLARASELVAPGQQLERTWNDAEGEWLDVSYAHDGSTWFQRHCLRRWSKLAAVITGQTEYHALEETMVCHARVVRTITPT